MSDEPTTDPRVYMAAERTFLAWIRTGLSLMGFGFVAARFGLFLREINQVRGGADAAKSYGVSLWFGVALVVIGVVVNVAAALHHIRLNRDLKEGNYLPGRPSRLGISVALVLALVGVIMGVYLVFVR